MPTLTEQRDVLITEARTIIDGAKTAGRSMTSAEVKDAQGKITEIENLTEKIKSAAEGEALLQRLGALGPDGHHPMSTDDPMSELRLGFGQRFADFVVNKMVDGNSKAILPSGSTLVPVEYDTAIVAQGQRPLTLLDVLPVKVRQQAAFSYFRQTARVPNASAVAVGGLKPTTPLGLELVAGALSVVATITDGIDRFWLSDVQAVRTWVIDEISYAVRTTIESQVVGGDGVAPNLLGFLNASGIQTQAFDTDALITLRRAITDIENLGYSPGVFVLNPSDWADVELTRASTSGIPDFPGTPVDRAASKVWSTPVVLTSSMPVGTGLLLGSTAAQLDVGREGLTVDWSENLGDDYARNLLRSRCEQRAHLSILRPASVVKVTLTAGP